MNSAILEGVDVGIKRLIFAIDDDMGRAGLDPQELAELQALQVKFASIDEAKSRFRSLRSAQLADADPEIVIILDLMFPNQPQPGLDFLRDIRQGVAGIPVGTPVIVHSAVGDPAVVKEAVQRGSSSYVVKGGHPQQLARAVRQAFVGEVLIADAICEVLDVDETLGRVAFRVRGDDGWVAERWLDWELCPVDARIPGGSFHLQTYRRFGSGRGELLVRSKPVDSDAEAKELDSLFGDL